MSFHEEKVPTITKKKKKKNRWIKLGMKFKDNT